MTGEPISRIAQEAEARRMAQKIAQLAPSLRAFQGTRRVCARRWQRSPNWVLAMEIYAVGSNYARAICEEMGVDPDAVIASTPTPQTGEGKR